MAQHLAKLFDSMSSLKFTLDENGKPSKEAVGMYSKDGEYVDFNKPCQCVGQVSYSVGFPFMFSGWLYIHVYICTCTCINDHSHGKRPACALRNWEDQGSQSHLSSGPYAYCYCACMALRANVASRIGNQVSPAESARSAGSGLSQSN